ncbi:MAG: hypothetical protein CMP28_13975 [Roseibacillus sp.]|nr:hypothetical protein [Roseibacillus sp.]
MIDQVLAAIVTPLKLACLLTTLLCPVLLEAGPLRVWHYTDGRKFTGEYQWSSPHILYLRDRKGREFEVQLGALSNADLEYVRGLNAEDASTGVVYHAPLTWEEFRAKNLTSSQAEERGYYPVDSRRTSEGSLRLQFRRFGPAPKLEANQKVVLRLTTARNGGTRSTIRASYQGKIIGTARGARSDSKVDLPLPASVLQGSQTIVLDLSCGSDPILIRTGKSGAGPRLLILEMEQEGE